MNLSNLKKPSRIGVLILMLLALLIYFVGPHISIGNSHPLHSASARSILIVLMVLAATGKTILQKITEHKTKILGKSWEGIKAVSAQVKTKSTDSGKHSCLYFGDLKNRFNQGQQRRQLKRTPWYLMIGTPHSGRKHLLAASGLTFVNPESYGRQALNAQEQFGEYQWFFTHNSVFVDLSSNQQGSDEAKQTQRKFIKFLRKQRRAKPISGVIVTISLAELLTKNNHDRQSVIASLAAQLREMHQLLKAQVPVYLNLTKADQVAGFTEFFNDLSKEELAQVWGVTLPLNHHGDVNEVSQFVTQEYSQLMLRLQQRVLWCLNSENHLRGRELIQAFPQQMQLFRKPITTFICELMGSARKAIQLRGFYFLSSLQAGQAHDFLTAAIANQYKLVAAKTQALYKNEESYFAERLFQEVILRESKLLGFSERTQRLKRLTYRFMYILVPAVLVLGTTSMYNAYTKNKQDLKLVKAEAAAYNLSLQNLSPSNTSIKATLPILAHLQRANNAYQQDIWPLDTLYESARLTSLTKAALNRALATLYLPRVAASLESKLKTTNQSNALYATLKGYLAFSNNNDTPSSSVLGPMAYYWNKKYQSNPHVQAQLKHLLQLAVNNTVTPLPLDRPLINQVREQLAQIVPAQRAYGLLSIRSASSVLPNISFSRDAGNAYPLIFKTRKHLSPISALYTNKGYQALFKSQASNIAGMVAADNKAIGIQTNNTLSESKAQVLIQMQGTYGVNYQSAWESALQQVHVKLFKNLPEAIKALDLLASNSSPLTKVLNIVAQNTAAVSGSQINVASEFKQLNQFTNNDTSKVTLSQVIKTIKALRNYLAEILAQTNSNKAAFQVAVAYMHGNSPIKTLAHEAASAPQPVGRWLMNIGNGDWQLVANKALAYINTAWKKQVYHYYQSNIAGRFPVDPHAKSEISITDFSHFFSAKGLLATFKTHYLSSFVNNDKSMSVAGHCLGLTQTQLNVFKRAEAVQRLFFPNGHSRPHFSFSITPRTLDPNSREITLAVGSRVIRYSHGPQTPITLNWPAANDAQESTVVLTTFGGEKYALSSFGPWSFFRIIDRAYLHSGNEAGHYSFSFGMNGHHASFTIISTNPIALFHLDDIKGFSAPKQLGRQA